MNPPFSLESWGYDDFAPGDPYDRFGFGLPPRDNGDYAWLQQVVKSLKPTGRAIVVMSQGVLFRGQPEQTEEEDGRNQKADAEYTIREAFVKTDLIECVIVLPSKLFYGNNVPGCLVVLNKRKAPDRKDKILVVWASRNYQANNPQNLLRRADYLRVLVPWRAFGSLDVCGTLIPQHQAELVAVVEGERDHALGEIDAAYGPLVAPLASLRLELADREAFAKKPAPTDKQEKVKHREEKKLNTERLKELKQIIKALEKLETEAESKRQAIRLQAEREVAFVNDTALDLGRICTDAKESSRYFTIVERPELEANEFSLNVPRYVDTFEPQVEVKIDDAVVALKLATENAHGKYKELLALLKKDEGS